MKEFTFKCWAKAQVARQQAKLKLEEMAADFRSEERGGADSIVIAIVIIVIVLALAIVFRTQIANWVNALFGKGSQDLNSAIKGNNNNITVPTIKNQTFN